MNNKAIGQYIQLLRKQRGMSQKDLAERLSVTFQAVSKWETGENLPDASILLALAEILDTTTDKILSGGVATRRRTAKVNVPALREGIIALEDLKNMLGKHSAIWRGAVEGINNRLGVNVDNCLCDERGKELLLSEAVVDCVTQGYLMEEQEVDWHFTSESTRQRIKKHLSVCKLFADKAKNYISYRPTYPPQVKTLIFSLADHPVIADIGSGTGKFSELLVENAKVLYAVEPNAQMRNEAETLLCENSNYISLAATAESTTLVDSSIDIITVAEAYHWFDNPAAKEEFRRILKPNGYVMLLWNQFVGAPYDNEKAQIEAQYRNHTTTTYKDRAESLFGNGNYQTAEFDNNMLQSYEEFIGGWSSASFIPKAGTDAYIDFVKQASDLFHRFSKNGMILSTIKTVCYYGKIKS